MSKYSKRGPKHLVRDAGVRPRAKIEVVERYSLAAAHESKRTHVPTSQDNPQHGFNGDDRNRESRPDPGTCMHQSDVVVVRWQSKMCTAYSH